MRKKDVLAKQESQRKAEDQKLTNEKNDIIRKKEEIVALELKLQDTQLVLEEKEEDKKRHEKFTMFLKKVAEMKDGDKEGFENIQELQNRFKSLKNENKKLLDRKS